MPCGCRSSSSPERIHYADGEVFDYCRSCGAGVAVETIERAPGAHTPAAAPSPIAPAPTEEPPTFVSPMLVPAGELPSGPAWRFEVKWDGMRAQLRRHDGALTLRSRPGRECLAQFPELEQLAAALPVDVVLDGELVCFDRAGRPDFDRLRDRIRARSKRAVAAAAAAAPATFVAFDALHVDGQATRVLPYSERRCQLAALRVRAPVWRAPQDFADGPSLLAASRTQALEGIVAKRVDASYAEAARSARVRKIKNTRRASFAVIGYARTPRGGLAGVAVAEASDERRFAGWVEYGLGRDRRLALVDALEQLPASRSRGRDPRTRWVPPQLAVTVDFQCWTRDRLLRHPVLRDWSSA